MWLADAPINTINPPAIYLTANINSAQDAGGDISHEVGVCRIVAGVEKIDPMSDASAYFVNHSNVFLDHKSGSFQFYADGSERKDTSIRIVEQPRHGSFTQKYPEATDDLRHEYDYTPDEGYEDYDYFVVEARAGEYTVQIYYTIKVNNLDESRARDRYNDDCPYEMMRISTLGKTYSTITFANLTGADVGETTGEGKDAIITLDTDAAGHGWYVGGLTTEDGGQATLSPTLSPGNGGLNGLTPWYEQDLFDMSNWLPTSNPNEWIARAGTDAAGKMDMLSVLLHEYGHALGIAHSADAHDYMGATLTPGMRRLPSRDEIQLMARLAGEAREAIVAGQGYTLVVDNDQDTPPPALPINMGFGISFLGLLRRNSPRPLAGEGLGERGNVAQNDTGFRVEHGMTGGVQSSVLGHLSSAYAIAANATLTNGTFAGNTTNAWETTGQVTTQANSATLNEVVSSQTRLNQVFVVGADDRYLSFTLSNIALEGTSALTQTSSLSPTPLPQGEGLPGDAFEVALLNANSGGSLAANIGLSRTDALLNYLLLVSMPS